MRDSRTLLLILLSVCLVGTWVFYIYDKVKKATVTAPTAPVIDTAARNKQLNDSLTTVYRSSVAQMEQTKTNEDSLNLELQAKIREIDTLRNEINLMLNINTLTREDLEKASKKIQQLQRQIAQISQVQDPAATQLQNTGAARDRVNSSATRTTSGKQPGVSTMPPGTMGSSQVLQAGDIRFQAYEKTDTDKGKLTSSSLQADFLSVSFTVRNRTTSFPGTQVYLVLKSPSGQVILDDEWLSGVFNSSKEGTIRYSRKLRFDYDNNETKNISTSVLLNRSEPGLYTVFIYHNGVRIGKAELSLQ